jgi:hypothetical protein
MNHRFRRIIDIVIFFYRIGGGSSLQRENIEPPLHHAITLAEEPMTTDVDAVSFVVMVTVMMIA